MSTIKVNTLDTTSGTAITVATGKTLTVGGKSVTAGSSNIQRATADVTVATTADYGVSGKSELVIAANAGAATRTITLCPVAETGVDTCIITVIADADATSTYKLMVVESDGTTEVWTGYQTGDFVRLIVNNSAWLVVDHKETYYSYRWLTADIAQAASANTKMTGWTNVTEIGNAWDNGNNQLVTPTGMNGYWTIEFDIVVTNQASAASPKLYINGSVIAEWGDGTESFSGTGVQPMSPKSLAGVWKTTSTQVIEFYAWNIQSNATTTVAGTAQKWTHFIAQFNRVY